MKLSQIRSKKQSVAFEVADNEGVLISGKCIPGLISESMLQGIVDAQTAMKNAGDLTPEDSLSLIQVQSEAVVMSVTEWSIQLEDGSPYPITREYVAKIDAEILGEIFTSIMGAQRPNVTTAEIS
jgi:hypothetical protein